MKRYLNAENVTALVIVIAGVIVASLIGPTIIGGVKKLTKRNG